MKGALALVVGLACGVAVLFAFGGARGVSEALPSFAAAAFPGSGMQRCAHAWFPERARRDCFTQALLDRFASGKDIPQTLAAMDRFADREEGLGRRCHGYMHRIAVRYADREGSDLARVHRLLPSRLDPNCAAGFGHGLVMHAIESDRLAPAEIARVCARSNEYLRIASCAHAAGHVFVRATKGEVVAAVQRCGLLGPRMHDDCPAGVFMEREQMTGLKRLEPAETCHRLAARFRGACWLRLSSPEDAGVTSTAKLQARCESAGGERGACLAGTVAGASVHAGRGVPEQVEICDGLSSRDDYRACLEGLDLRTSKASSVRACLVATRRDRQHRCAEHVGSVLGLLHGPAVAGRWCGSASGALVASCRGGARRPAPSLGVL